MWLASVATLHTPMAHTPATQYEVSTLKALYRGYIRTLEIVADHHRNELVHVHQEVSAGAFHY